jgi:hypothetical protein
MSPLIFSHCSISGERTLADFFERLPPFGAVFMALFGRATLPHHATLSRFLADVDGSCLEAFRTFFEQFRSQKDGHRMPLVESSIGKDAVTDLAPIGTLLANSSGSFVKPLKSRDAGRSEWVAIKPVNKTNHIDRCRDGRVLQMRFRQPHVA